MKYLKKYKFIIERKDLEKREKILDLMNDIFILIKNHYINIIDELLDKRKTIEDYLDDMKLRSSALEIPLTNFKFIIKIKKYNSKNKDDRSAGSYERDKKNNYFLIISLNNFYELIEDIFFIDKKNFSTLKNDILNYELEDKEKYIIFHELIHATDDMKYDLFQNLRNACKKSKLQDIYDIGVEKNPNYNSNLDPIFMAEYDNVVYPNLNTEYNAYFLTAVDKLLTKLKDNEVKWEQINDFDTFKDFFMILSLRYFDFYNKTTKYKKHYDKRMYDLFIKLKEKFESKKFESKQPPKWLDNQRYWKIKYSDFDVAMDKLDVPTERRKIIKDGTINSHINQNQEILLTNWKFGDTIGWNWRFIHDSIINDPKWTNMGDLIITPEDINKYEINSKAKKYNIL